MINDAGLMVAFTISNNDNEDIRHIEGSYQDLSNMITTSKVVVVDNNKSNEEAAAQIFNLFEVLAYRSVLRLPELSAQYGLTVKQVKVFDDQGEEVTDREQCTYTCKDILPGWAFYRFSPH